MTISHESEMLQRKKNTTLSERVELIHGNYDRNCSPKKSPR